MSLLSRLKSKPPQSDAHKAHDEITKLRREVGHQQSLIDSLMLEFCPERMSKEQIELWSDSQEVVK